MIVGYHDNQYDYHDNQHDQHDNQRIRECYHLVALPNHLLPALRIIIISSW